MSSKNLVYVSYIDKPSKIDLLKYNLNFVKKYFDNIILVYSSYNDKPLPKNFCNLKEDQIVLHSNEGYDFEKYKFGVKSFLNVPTKYTVIMNDSVTIASNLHNVFSSIDVYFDRGYEYLGFVENQEIKTHFQSWFLVFSLESLNYFYNYLKKPISDKQKVINEYEVNLSSKMIKEFKSMSLFESPHNPFYFQDVIDNLFKENKLFFVKNNSFHKKFKSKPHKMDLKKTLSYLTPESSDKLSLYLNE